MPRTTVKKMTCKCGSKTIKRQFKVNAAGHVVGKAKQDAAKLAKIPGAKKAQGKKVAAKKTKGTPCKCNNPFGGTKKG